MTRTAERRPTPRTPGGAYLKVRRGPKWTSIEVDRIPVTDATDDQAATAHRLTMAAARHVAALGKRGWLGIGDGRIIWSVVVATADADVALDALLALEAGDPGPAESLADRYEAAS